MDFRDIARLALEEARDGVLSALDGLTAEERRFQPGPESHHVDFVLWHVARVEDNWIHGFALQTDSVWEREGWHSRFAMPEKGGGTGYTPEQVAGLPRFNLDDMLAYYTAVRESTLRYIDGLAHDDLDSMPDTRRRPDYTIADMLGHLIVEQSHHMGQIAYVRGMQRGLNE